MYERAPMLPGMIPTSPSRARTAPFFWRRAPGQATLWIAPVRSAPRHRALHNEQVRCSDAYVKLLPKIPFAVSFCKYLNLRGHWISVRAARKQMFLDRLFTFPQRLPDAAFLPFGAVATSWWTERLQKLRSFESARAAPAAGSDSKRCLAGGVPLCAKTASSLSMYVSEFREEKKGAIVSDAL